MSNAPNVDEDLPDDLRKFVMNGFALAPAGANVIMQLSRLAVGRGIVESRVESGSLHRHPFKRTRTTLGYVMIALMGTADERTALRREVGRQHRFVVSDANSPVPYSAFDPELQLWVAACMYHGVEDSVRFLYGATPPSTFDALYRHCGRFATTLQVPASMWPADRAAFDDYWTASIQHVAMDDVTRDYLYGIASLAFLPAPIAWLLGPAHRFITTGFLPPRFRDELGLTWSARRQMAFQASTALLCVVNRLLPRSLREFPWNASLNDARRRLGSGRSFV